MLRGNHGSYFLHSIFAHSAILTHSQEQRLIKMFISQTVFAAVVVMDNIVAHKCIFCMTNFASVCSQTPPPQIKQSIILSTADCGFRLFALYKYIQITNRREVKLSFPLCKPSCSGIMNQWFTVTSNHLSVAVIRP